MASTVEKAVRRIGIPALTRVWMEGNLKWALAVGAFAALGVLLLVAAWLLLSVFLWALAFAAFLTALFLYCFAGMKRGLFLKPVWRAPEASNALVLTFDDGPHPDYTPRILDILAAHQVPAVFFLAGKNVRRYPRIVRRIEDAGHETGCHTYSHANLRWASAARLHEDLTRFEQLFARMGFRAPRLFRPPNGAKSPIVEWVLRRRGYRLVHWTVSPKDWRESDSPEAVLERLHQHARPGAIILLHDSANAVAVLPEFIEWARARGMRFAPLGEFLVL